MARPSHPPLLDHSNYTWRRVEIMKLFVTQFSPVTSSVFGGFLCNDETGRWIRVAYWIEELIFPIRALLFRNSRSYPKEQSVTSPHSAEGLLMALKPVELQMAMHDSERKCRNLDLTQILASVYDAEIQNEQGRRITSLSGISLPVVWKLESKGLWPWCMVTWNRRLSGHLLFLVTENSERWT
jgi:hypothetical protein